MLRKEMYPLCCISIDCPGIGDRSPDTAEREAESVERCGQEGNAGGEGESEVSVAGVLHKWTNFGKGWRSRWFTLRNGVIAYYKVRRRGDRFFVGEGVRLIGGRSNHLSWPTEDGAEGRRLMKPVGVVYLKIASFRESRSDDRRFYIFSPTKTLQLKTNSKVDREAWIKALISARKKLSRTENISFFRNDVSFSTENLRIRMRDAGINEGLIKDCEQIMQTEFSESYRQLKLHYEEHLMFFGSYQQQLEGVHMEDGTRTLHDGSLQLLKNEFSSSGHEKFSEYSTTESSDDVEKPDLEELSDEEEPCFFDTADCFSDSSVINASQVNITDHADEICSSEDHSVGIEMMTHVETDFKQCPKFPHVERRKKLPDPIEKEKGVSLWSMIRDNVGKDLTRVCLPVYFNEPLSSLQKCFEDLEYSHLLDKAYEYGMMGNSLMRIMNVAAFAVSGYASSDGRLCKPFNPLLGETYEADFPDKGVRFFSEKVSHHPMLVACHCEGKGWKFWGDSNLKSKFWGQSIQLDPIGVLTLEFDDGEVFQWNKVTTTIYNLILGKVYCGHHGTMNICGNRQYCCKLKFKDHTLLDRNPRQVQGFVEDGMGVKVATIFGKWDDHIYYISGDDPYKVRGGNASPDATLLWKKSEPPENPTRYNLTSFAITLNELTPGLQEKLPPTDSRLRPDQRYLENGEYEKANEEKQRLEKRQRMVIMASPVLISDAVEWKDLKAHVEDIKSTHLRNLMSDVERCKSMIVEYDEILLDYSRQCVNYTTLEKLLKLAEAAQLKDKINRMYNGGHINFTEDRPVLHIALRAARDSVICSDGRNVVPDVWHVLDKITDFTERIRNGSWVGATGKPLKDVVAVGIGGSFLGPLFVHTALQTDSEASEFAKGRQLRFLANVDPVDVARSINGLNPETTLVVVVSKTFTTAETMLNARTLREWISDALGPHAIAKHMVAVSTNLKLVEKFGIDPCNAFAFWDWVGGRFSVCSAVGVLPLSLQYGFPVIRKFLDGACSIDRHFYSTSFEQNIPVLLGLLSVWNTSFLGFPARAILPYSQALEKFAPHIQQLSMESNGKGVSIDGIPLPFETGEIDFGEPGTNGQHSFYQLIHQGRVIPCDFIGIVKSQQPVYLKGEIVSNHDELMSNFFAQPDALAYGKFPDQLQSENVANDLIPHKTFSGNRPSLCLLLPSLCAYNVGQLLAIYEHRIAVEGFIWGINSFDQWGVELGKSLASKVRNQLHLSRTSEKHIDGFNYSTTTLLSRYLQADSGIPSDSSTSTLPKL